MVFARANVHVPIRSLWDDSKGLVALEPNHAEHLERCEECLAIEWICAHAESIDQVLAKLNRLGFDRA